MARMRLLRLRLRQLFLFMTFLGFCLGDLLLDLLLMLLLD